MGSTCEACCAEEHQKVHQTEIKNQNWADAVLKNNFTAIKILHHNDPDLINDPVDQCGGVALHYAVRNKNGKLIDYLLNNGANINIQGGPDYNSALHEAAIHQDFKSIRQLFSYGINDKLKNNKGKTALLLLDKKYHREYTKAKQFRFVHLLYKQYQI